MLIVPDISHYNKMLAAAVADGSFSALMSKLNYLANYGEEETQCTLYADDAGFSFVMQHVGCTSYWFNGGLVYHSYDGSWGVHT